MKLLQSPISMLAAGLLLVAAPAFANSARVVTNNPPGNANCQGQPGGCATDAACVREGEYALRITKDVGDTSKTFVEDNSPLSETIYRAQFWINPSSYNGLDFNKDGLAIALPEGAGTAPYKILSRLKPGVGYKIFCQAARNSGQKKSTGRLTLANDYNLVQIEWQQASAPGINDGFCRISIIDGPAAGTTSTVNIKNDQLTVGRFRMGLTGSLDGPADGHMCFDSFASFRTLAP